MKRESTSQAIYKPHPNIRENAHLPAEHAPYGQNISLITADWLYGYLHEFQTPWINDRSW